MIKRYLKNEELALHEVVVVDNTAYISFCAGNIGGTIEEQINGAIDDMENKLKIVDISLKDVVSINYTMRDIYNIPIMEKVFKERFNGEYPARMGSQTNYAHIGGPDGLHFQMSGVAYIPQTA